MSEERQRAGGVTIDELMASPPKQSNNWRRLPRLIRQAVKLVWRAGPVPFIVMCTVQVFQGLVMAAQVLLARELLVALESGKTGDAKLGALLPVLGFFIVLFSVARIGAAIQGEQSELLQELVSNQARRDVMTVAGRVDLIAYEDSSFYDHLQRAAQGSGFRTIQMVQGLANLSGSVFRVAGIATAIAILKPILLVPLVFAYVPLWYATRRNSNDTYGFVSGMTQLERQRDYTHLMLTNRETAKDVRAFGLLDFLTGRFEQLSAKHVTERRRVIRRRLRRQSLAGLESTLLMAATVGLLAWFYASGQISLAAAGAVMAALLQFSGALYQVGMGSGGLYESSLFLDDYTSFMALARPGPVAPPSGRPPSGFGELVLDRVTFTYPGRATPAISDVSLRIKAGEVVALVGENGSGKTTLAKLMAGLYQPANGRILWDGTDMADHDLDELRSSVTILFQDFLRYHMTVRENIGLGRPEFIDDISKVKAAAELAGIYDALANLPDGLETMLGREFLGGQELSGGQWQRMALARAFFRDAPFVVLDEPTASLDARAEQQLFEHVGELFKGRAVLLISHRFANVRSADRIYVLKSGRVVEHGSHESLIAEGGLYAELFGMQAAAYVGEV
jgi:ATP-binding cassette, subfamily B, bacterial